MSKTAAPKKPKAAKKTPAKKAPAKKKAPSKAKAKPKAPKEEKIEVRRKEMEMIHILISHCIGGIVKAIEPTGNEFLNAFMPQVSAVIREVAATDDDRAQVLAWLTKQVLAKEEAEKPEEGKA